LNRTVAVICGFDNTDLTGASSIVISGILVEATERNYEIKIYSDDDLDASFSKILGGQIQNVISMSTDSSKRAEEAALCEKHKLKMMYIYEKAEGPYKTVVTANRQSVREAMAYLVKNGHKRIGFVSGPLSENYTFERYKGYCQGLADAGLKEKPEFVICGETIDEWVPGIEKILKMSAASRPTAFFCTTDSTAFLMQKIAVKNGFLIPEDVSVVGFGNMHLCKFALSPLTSISEAYTDLGKTALRALLDANGSCNIASGNRYLLPGRLVIRESVCDLGKINDLKAYKRQKGKKYA